jgi:hypothetical protein
MSEDSEDKGRRSARFAERPRTFHRYPYTGARYGAYDGQHVLVEQDGEWGIFTRNAEWIEGSLRVADPTFARWVTGKLIMDAVLEESRKSGGWS